MEKQRIKYTVLDNYIVLYRTTTDGDIFEWQVIPASEFLNSNSDAGSREFSFLCRAYKRISHVI